MSKHILLADGFDGKGGGILGAESRNAFWGFCRYHRPTDSSVQKNEVVLICI